MNTEFWTVVINGSANLIIAGVAIAQLILLFLTFKIGSNFLNDHRKKIKEERRLELIKSAKDKITLFNIIANRIYDIPSSLLRNLEDDSFDTSSLINHFFQDFYFNKKEDKNKINELSAEVSTNLILLNRKDLQEKWFLCHSNTVGLDLFYSGKKNMIENTTDLKSKRRFFSIIPTSFSSGNHHLIQNQDY